LGDPECWLLIPASCPQAAKWFRGLPNLRFAADRRFARASAFCGAAVEHGVIVHRRHNWFVSAAHTDDDVERVLEATWEGFLAVRREFGTS
jgi:glutamate-1-semialdehyde 2,1-aminomutase